MSSVLLNVSLFALTPFGVLYILLPALYYLFPNFMQHTFFLNLWKLPFIDYSRLSIHGVVSFGRNFYIEVYTLERMKDINKRPNKKYPRLGTWHILPSSISKLYTKSNQVPSDADMESSLSDGHQPILIYLHGNSFDRAYDHRVELYNVLSEMDYHILSIDYRGYGDSSGYPSEDGLIEDALTIYEYAKTVAPSKKVYIWGHSMGSGVASRFVAELSDIHKPPAGLILESPFNNLPDVVKHHPFSLPYRNYPFFDQIVLKPLMDSGLVMSSDKHIQRIICPILVLAAQDDYVIPYFLARRLVEAAKSVDRDIRYIEFETERGFLHKYICRAMELPDLLTSFMRHCEEKLRVRNSISRAAFESESGA